MNVSGSFAMFCTCEGGIVDMKSYGRLSVFVCSQVSPCEHEEVLTIKGPVYFHGLVRVVHLTLGEDSLAAFCNRSDSSCARP